MSFIFSWNQFLFSLILSGLKTKTVPVAVYNFISYGKIDWAGIGAAATLIVLPVSVFAFFGPEIHRSGPHDGGAEGLRPWPAA
jgi:multiple sugar transport system permease protein